MLLFFRRHTHTHTLTGWPEIKPEIALGIVQLINGKLQAPRYLIHAAHMTYEQFAGAVMKYW